MRDNREMILPIFSFETNVQYSCPDGFVASNLQEAKEHEVWYTSRNFKNGMLEPLVGTALTPYNYIDQGVDIYIFEREGYVCVLSALDWESYSDKFTGFRVNAEEFYTAWKELSYPEPYR